MMLCRSFATLTGLIMSLSTTFVHAHGLSCEALLQSPLHQVEYEIYTSGPDEQPPLIQLFLQSARTSLKELRHNQASSAQFTEVILKIIGACNRLHGYSVSWNPLSELAQEIVSSTHEIKLLQADAERLKSALRKSPLRSFGSVKKTLAEFADDDWGQTWEQAQLERTTYKILKLAAHRKALEHMDYYTRQLEYRGELLEKARNHYVQTPEAPKSFLQFAEDTLKDLVNGQVRSFDFVTMSMRLIYFADRYKEDLPPRTLAGLIPTIHKGARKLGLLSHDIERLKKALAKVGPVSMDDLGNSLKLDWGIPLDERANERFAATQPSN